jgi:hypothetical protein
MSRSSTSTRDRRPTGADWQTKDLGCTLGSWTLDARLDGAPGSEGEPIELPFTGRIAICTDCIRCPALFDELDGGGNVIVPWVEFEVDLADSVVRRAERVSESTAEHLAGWIEQYGCEGPRGGMPGRILPDSWISRPWPGCSAPGTGRA